MAELPIQLQADSITQVPGGGVRAISAVVMLNGVPTPVIMQVVAMADAQGRVLPGFETLTDPLDALLGELRDIKRLLALIAQVPEPLITDANTDTRR